MSESEQYAYARRTTLQLDPTLPAAQSLIRFAQEVWGRAIRTMTDDELAALDAQIARNREMRRRMFQPKPVMTHGV